MVNVDYSGGKVYCSGCEKQVDDTGKYCDICGTQTRKNPRIKKLLKLVRY